MGLRSREITPFLPRDILAGIYTGIDPGGHSVMDVTLVVPSPYKVEDPGGVLAMDVLSKKVEGSLFARHGQRTNRSVGFVFETDPDWNGRSGWEILECMRGDGRVQFIASLRMRSKSRYA